MKALAVWDGSSSKHRSTSNNGAMLARTRRFPRNVSPIVERTLAPAFHCESYDGRRISLERYQKHHNVLLVLMRGLT